MSRLRTQYGKVFKKWTGRPDLMKRVRRVLADPSLCEVSVQQIADYLREPPEQVWDCLAFLNDQYDLVAFPTGMKGKKRTVLFGMPWKIQQSMIHNLDETPLLMFPFGKEPDKKELKCPGCGRLLKRRHGRSEYHDPWKCQMFNLRDIMEEK